MFANGIYRTKKGEKVILNLYEEQLSGLGIEYTSRMVNTRFGKTHVLIAGPDTAEKVVILHGGNSTNPYNLRSFLPVVQKFRVYAPDTVGHPGKSAQKNLSPRDDSYGKWVADLLEELEIRKSSFIGVSYGGGVLLRFASYAPEYIEKAVLVVPSGIANCSLLTITIKLGLPMILYRLFPSRKRLINAIKPMSLREDIDEATIEMVETVFKHVKVKTEMPQNSTKKELQNLSASTIVIVGRKDVLFPGDKVAERAKKIIPNLESCEVYDFPHMYAIDQESQDTVNRRIITFLSSA